jgi:co-chaperonin GroES (HSP10)
MNLKFEADGVPAALLPVPAGWRILISPVKLRDVSDGGIALPASSVQAAEYFRNIAKVLAIGATAYDDPSFRGGNIDGPSMPWCKVGDIIHYQCHDGVNLTISYNKQKHNLRFINDRNVISGFRDNNTEVIEELV